MAKKHKSHEDENGSLQKGWTLLDVPAGPFLALQGALKKRRATHAMGVAASGTFQVVDEPTFPAHDFFLPARKFPLQARYATLSSLDDASNDVRGVAIRLAANVDEPSPFDMLMNSGPIAGPATMATFTVGVITRWLPQRVFDNAVEKNIQYREALISGRRRAPDSFATLRFYSQTVRYWLSTDGVRYLVRYRMVPADPSVKESGIPSTEDAAQIWKRDRYPTEHRPSDYLRQEVRNRLAAGNAVNLMFQAQFHRPQPGDTLDWFNSGVDWIEDDHPWHDVARVQLDAALTDEQAELLCFNSSNHPASLSVPIADSPFDYRSVADSERRVIAQLQKYRLRIYKLFGFPKFGDTKPKAGQ